MAINRVLSNERGEHDYVDGKPVECEFVACNLHFSCDAVIGTKTRKDVHEQFDMIEKQLDKIPGIVDVIVPGGANWSWGIEVEFEKIPDMKKITDVRKRIEKAVNRYADKC